MRILLENEGWIMFSVTIKNPETGEIKTLDQKEFNKYMAMTNGDVLNWIVNPAP